METLSILSVLPVLTILVTAVITKRTLFAMLCGLTAGAVIISGGVSGLIETWFGYFYTSMSNETLQWLILVIAMFGMLIVIFERSHAVQDFGAWASRFMNTEKKALLGTIALGFVVFLDDYLNNLAVSTTMKGITDKLRIPRSQLAYTVNSVAAPVCVLIPLSSWAVYFGKLLEKEGVTGPAGTGISAYISAIPLVFYGWLAILVVLLQVMGIIPRIGMIRRDTLRARETGDVFPEGTDPRLAEADLSGGTGGSSEKAGGFPAENGQTGEPVRKQNLSPFPFLIPLAVMIAVTLLTGTNVLIGSLAGVAAGILLYGLTRRMSPGELLTACFDGIVNMGFVMILCVLAFAVQALNVDLMLAEYVISVTKPVMSGAFLPAVVFLVCAVYAYATGCFWDLAAIIIPIVIPLAFAMDVSPLLAGAAVFSGAAFGSNTCLYGDGVIMCSQGAQIKSIDLMMATLPYALIAGGGSAVLYLITGFIMHT